MNMVSRDIGRAITILLFSGLLFLPNILKAQQDIGFTQYMYNPLTVNSAYAGTKDAIDFVLLSRQQWVGWEGAPETVTFTIHGPVDEKLVGLGLSYVRDQIGPLTTNNVYADYAFRIRVHEGGTLSMGLKTGIDVRRNRISNLSPLDPTDSWYDTDRKSKTSFQFGAGLYYYTDNYYLGLSVPKLRNTLFDNYDPNLVSQSSQERHYYMIGGYVWSPDEVWKIKPSFLAKKVWPAPMALDLNLSAMYNNLAVAGITRRIDDSWGLMMQFRLFEQLWVGYAYDLTTSPLKTHNSGTHEILLSFELYRFNPEAVRSPRFF